VTSESFLKNFLYSKLFISTELQFDEGIEEILMEVEVLYDDEKEMRESFTVRLEPDTNMVAELGVCISS